MTAKKSKLITPLYGFVRSIPAISPRSAGAWKTVRRPSLKTNPTEIPPPGKSTNSTITSTIRILTWNVWFSSFFKPQRTSALLRITRQNGPDVCCFQEVTKDFERALRADNHFRDEWLMTKISDQWKKLGAKSWYGTIVMVRKSLIQRGDGFNASAYYVPFEGTTTGRCLTVLELLPKRLPSVTPPIRVGTIHLDYTPQLRRTHLGIAVQALASLPSPSSPPVSSILCGDTNFKSYTDEVRPLLNAGYKDAWLTSHLYEDGKNLFLVGPTYAVAGVRFHVKSTGEVLNPSKGLPRRLDLIMYRGFAVKGSVERLGKDLIAKEVLLKEKASERSVEAYDVYPSDHLGLIADMDWAGIE